MLGSRANIPTSLMWNGTRVSDEQPMRALHLLALSLPLACASSGGAEPSLPPETSQSIAAAEPTPADQPPEASTPPCADQKSCFAKGSAAQEANDEAAARKFYAHGCELGFGDSCNTLGISFDKEDPPRAHELKQRACELDNASGCLNAAEDLRSRDPSSAVQLYIKACRAFAGPQTDTIGKSLACHRGSLTAFSNKQYAEAVEMAELICDGKATQGCSLAGQLHREGLGTPKSIKRARELLQRGCEGDDKRACEHASRLSDAAPSDAGPGGAGSDELAVPKANITMASVSVDGVNLKQLACRTRGGGFGALLAGPALAKTVASRKKALVACAPKGGEARVRWTAAGGRITKVEVKANSSKIETCVSRVLKGAKSPNAGTCAATIPLDP